jgi:hypothetical protein
VKTEAAYSFPARSAAFAIWPLVGDRSAETCTNHARSPSGQSLVVEGYFACWFVVLALGLAVDHPLPCHPVVAAQARIGSSTCCYGLRQQSRVESR